MSLVLAADYRMPDFDHWWAVLSHDLPRLPSLGAHHIVVDAAAFLSEAGEGPYPPLFVGRLVQAIEVPQD